MSMTGAAIPAKGLQGILSSPWSKSGRAGHERHSQDEGYDG
jgi:hypothetical protein